MTVRRLLAWIVDRLFPPKPIEGVAAKVSDPDPYRPPPNADVEHPADCRGCDWLDNYGRWQPPEVVLATGIPFPCLSKQWNKTQAELISMAEGYGLKVERR